MTEAQAAATTVEWASAHLPVVVGVDGSEGSRSALAWAADEAGRAGADLRVAIAAGYHRRFGHGRQQAERTVAAMAGEVSGVPVEQVSHAVYDGPPETALLEHLDDARLLVIGKRGLGTLGRLFVGSVSLAVAGRSPVPVAVVPTGWDQTAHRTGPLVVGVEPDQPNHHLLHLTFHRAERLGVPVVAVHGWEAPSAEPTDGAPIAGEAEAHARFEDAVAKWRERFPDVDVRVHTSSTHPALAVLQEAEAAGAQLVILGRHHSNRFAGFGFGSVTRAVLHYTEVPVLVVPTDEDEA
jgi:nucleotide-binding universal stress UspA family protein